MNIDEKIQRLHQLLTERDEINAQIAELFGSPEPPPVTEKGKKGRIVEPAPKGKNKCSLCGKAGHSKRTCSSRGTVPSGRTVKIEQPEETREPLTEDQFDDMKHLQKIGDLSSKSFASENGVAIAEVNKAITARTYSEYRNW